MGLREHLAGFSRWHRPSEFSRFLGTETIPLSAASVVIGSPRTFQPHPLRWGRCVEIVARKEDDQ